MAAIDEIPPLKIALLEEFAAGNWDGTYKKPTDACYVSINLGWQQEGLEHRLEQARGLESAIVNTLRGQKGYNFGPSFRNDYMEEELVIPVSAFMETGKRIDKAAFERDLRDALDEYKSLSAVPSMVIENGVVVEKGGKKTTPDQPGTNPDEPKSGGYQYGGLF